MNEIPPPILQQIKRRNILLLVALINTLGVIYYLSFLKSNGYLPPPFFYIPSDTLMDLMNSMYWAFEDGRYTDWKSVYPPLNFIILKLLNYVFQGTVESHPALMRENSPILIIGYCLIHLLLPVIILKSKYWINFTLSEKVLAYIAIIFSSPMLFVVERGNLIIFCPILLSFVLSKTGLVRCLWIAVLINLKPYFVLLTLLYFIRRAWKWLTVCIVFSGIIFVGTGQIVDNHYFELFSNLVGFSEGDIFALKEVMVTPSSISAFSYVLKNLDIGASFIGFAGWPTVATIIDGLKLSALIYSLIVLTLKESLASDSEIILMLAVIITNLGTSVGGYSLIFYIPLIPIFISMRYKKLYIVLLTLMAIPLDFIPLVGYDIGEWYSFISDSNVHVHWTLGIRSIILPITNFILLVAVSLELMNRKRNNCNVKVSVPLGGRQVHAS